MAVEINEDDISFENYQLYCHVDILKFIELNRMRWAGYLMRNKCDRAALKVFNAVSFGQQPGGKPKER